MTMNDPFVAIIKGVEPGTIIHKDDKQRFALIENKQPFIGLQSLMKKAQPKS
jgi:hypothetical protein